jgi:hypothetical protein
VFVIISNLVLRLTIAAVGHEPALRRVGQDATRKIGPYPDQSQRCEGISRVFHLAQHRKPHLGNGDMGHLMKQHEQHIAGYEFRALLNIFWRKAFESWIAFAERLGSRVDPVLKFS